LGVGGTSRHSGPPVVVGHAASGVSKLDVERVLQPLGEIAECFRRLPEVSVLFLELPDSGNALCERVGCLLIDHCISSDAMIYCTRAGVAAPRAG
jgi:hypothetical protein